LPGTGDILEAFFTQPFGSLKNSIPDRHARI
jgi:hypothetical protein